jgi:hypothetical protein
MVLLLFILPLLLFFFFFFSHQLLFFTLDKESLGSVYVSRRREVAGHPKLPAAAPKRSEERREFHFLCCS